MNENKRTLIPALSSILGIVNKRLVLCNSILTILAAKVIVEQNYSG